MFDSVAVISAGVEPAAIFRLLAHNLLGDTWDRHWKAQRLEPGFEPKSVLLIELYDNSSTCRWCHATVSYAPTSFSPFAEQRDLQCPGPLLYLGDEQTDDISDVTCQERVSDC
jgi:hypothetical protein